MTKTTVTINKKGAEQSFSVETISNLHYLTIRRNERDAAIDLCL